MSQSNRLFAGPQTKPFASGGIVSSFLCLLALLLLQSNAGAQLLLYDGNMTLPPYGGFSDGDFDTVSLQNGNLHLHIPIGSWQQRGGKTIQLALVYDSAAWSGQTTVISENDQRYYRTVITQAVVPNLSENSNDASWQVASPFLSVYCPGLDTNVYEFSSFTVTDPENVAHPVNLQTGQCPSYQTITQGPTQDGTGIMVNIGTNPAIYLKDGTQIPLVCPTQFSCSVSGSLQDTNGNIVAATDTMQRALWTTTYSPPTTLTTPLNATIQAPQYEYLTVTDSSGSSRMYTITYTAIDVTTHFCGHLNDPPLWICNEPDTVYAVPQLLTLPTGGSYQFSWKDSTPAELGSITLPTGGVISYGYASVCISAPPMTGVTFAPFTCKAEVTHRSETASGINNSWSYNIGTGIDYTTTVTDPMHNQQVHTFSQLSVNNAVSSSTVETQVDYYQGSAVPANLLKQVVTNYTGEPGFFNSTVQLLANIRPTSVTTTLANGLASQIQTDYETFSYNGLTWTRSNPTEVREYDYITGSQPGLLLRRTDFQYLHNSNSTYTNLNIVDRVTQKTIYDGSSNQSAQTIYEYDNYSHYSQPMVASGAVQHNSSFNTSYLTRGNVTAISRWNNATGASLTSTNQYDDAGNVLSTIDPMGNKTAFDFTDSWSNASCAPNGQGKVYLTTLTNGLNQQTKYSYNSCTGLQASMTDANLQSTNKAYDLMGRVTNISYPDAGSIGYCYSDVLSGNGGLCSSGPPFQVNIAKAITATVNETETIILDGLGRVSQTQLTSDPDGTTYTLKLYNGYGEVSQVYNPTRCSSITSNCLNENTWGSTAAAYDGLDRATSVTEQDGSIVQTAYDQTNSNSNGTCMTVTDEAGNARQSCSDALSRITGVWEDPGSAPHFDYETDYTYSPLGDLTSVTQKGNGTPRKRTFTYDSLSRLLCAANPEVQAVTCPSSASGPFPWGAITYTYDADSDVITKTAPSPNQLSPGTATVVTTYSYDQLNRLARKSYADSYNPPTAAVTYGYDGNSPSGCNPPIIQQPANSGIAVSPTNTIGRRSAMCDGSGATAWIYDSMGRPTIEERTLGGVTKNIGYVYTRGGQLNFLWYASDDPMNFEIDAAGRTYGVIDQSVNYVFGNATFAPPGQIASMSQYVKSGSNTVGFTSWFQYNTRLQPAQAYAVYSGTTYLYQRCYDFHLAGGLNINFGGFTCAFSGTSPGDNGNVYQIQNALDDTRTQNFTYDSLNRVNRAYTDGSNWGQQFSIDAWGNLYAVAAVSGKTLVGGFSATPTASNQLSNPGSGYSFDTAGNMLSYGDGSIVYDAENRILTAGGISYTYDGDGKRVEKSGGTLYWTGVGTEVLSESDLSGNINEEYVFLNGERVSRVDRPSGNVHGFLTDHLGSSRMIVTPSSSNTLTVEQDLDYTPYGIVATGAATDHYEFTSKERDAESGLDYFDARHYGSSLGRFMQPDPSGLLAQHPGDPQSWNLYVYARNNPLIYLDLNGLDCIYATDNGKSVESIDHDSNSGECGQHGGTWLSGYVDEDWAHYSNRAKAFEAASEDGGQVNFAQFQAGAQTNDSGNCLSGCGSYGFASASADWLTGQFVGNSKPTDGSDPLDGLLTFMTKRNQAVSDFWKVIAGPLDPSNNNWAGPGGMGPPRGRGDWAAAVHDYNFDTNHIKIGSYFNPFLSLATSRALIKSNNTLMRNAGGIQSLKMGLFFGPVNALQWYANSWK